ncbi:hypothetical protein TRFO_27495 [Tritrichomonas foetus]|uniref:Trafficking protein particle complex subunit 11 C-terminal domain-containing protein n=1 Tax=Tritrichomonas foetus TaxID=1144522 RepID=A0A1J4K279_9EUKA|nr:hypothetical protein TRFO_27495 [Tritrichomonas foetus]|eukprot:OHT04888.1 hypothetical protein TRFO_27495 [Tritrichomonas foetus]
MHFSYNMSYNFYKKMNEADTLQFGTSLSNILSALTNSNYSDIEPIKTELKAESIESALKLLETKLIFFSSCNFHPISASITKILAFAYHVRNENEKFILYGFKCISPLYQRFLSSELQSVFLKTLPSCPAITVDISQISSFPFDISAGFANMMSSPSDDVSFLLTVRSLLEYEVTFDSISVTVDHTKDKSSTHQILGQTTLERHQRVKQYPTLPIHRPGVVTINSISFKLHEIVLNVKIFKEIGYHKTSIKPYDTECKFEIIQPDFGVTNVDFPLKIKCDNIPEGAESFIIEAIINSEPPTCTIKEINDLQFKETIENPPKLIEKTLLLNSPKKCNVNISIQWSLIYETVNTTHENTFSVHFSDSFATTFKLFGPDRTPINLKNSPVLCTDQQYILVTTFEYNLPVQSTITELHPIPASCDVKLDQVIFDVPLDVLTSEAFTSVCYLTFTDNAKSGSLGKYTMKYKVNDSNDVLEYDVILPNINIKEKVVDIEILTPEEIIENVKSQLTLNIKGLLPTNAVLDISADDNYKIVGDFKKNISLQQNETDSIQISFIPTHTGKVTLHPFIVDNNEIVLWESAFSVDVKPNNIQQQEQ